MLQLSRVSDALGAIGRAVEAVDVEPEYFSERPIQLETWLDQMNQRYSAQFDGIILRIDAEPSGGYWIAGSDYLLDTIFWNLWTNAQQAVSSQVEITARIRRHGSSVQITVLDNGPGFPPTMGGVGFVQKYSTKSIHRGRGLLEIAEAAVRLRGAIELINVGQETLRARLTLPIAPTP
jgi:C4-dicarboxylate-specific signal transduction histidine kinase